MGRFQGLMVGAERYDRRPRDAGHPAWAHARARTHY